EHSPSPIWWWKVQPADYRNKKLLFHLRRRDLLQIRPSSILPGHRLGMPLLVPPALATQRDSIVYWNAASGNCSEPSRSSSQLRSVPFLPSKSFNLRTYPIAASTTNLAWAKCAANI